MDIKFDSAIVRLFMNVRVFQTIQQFTASWFNKDFHSEKQLLLDSNFTQHPQPATTSHNKKALSGGGGAHEHDGKRLTSGGDKTRFCMPHNRHTRRERTRTISTNGSVDGLQAFSI
jgi:hypothetical protein